MGFLPAGIKAGSFAAWLHSMIGPVKAGSLFAYLQSLGKLCVIFSLIVLSIYKALYSYK